MYPCITMFFKPMYETMWPFVICTWFMLTYACTFI